MPDDPARSTHRHLVLLVEDDHVTRDLFGALARSIGLNAVSAENGRIAMRVLRTRLRPCLIVLDLSTPETDGFAFRREQLADPALAAIPVAVLSGGDVVEAEARTLGLTCFLRKPVDPVELLKQFAEHCTPTTSPGA